LAPFFFAAGAAPAEIILRLPVDCTLGDDCYIQQYVDRDPGPAQLDFACGALANDGHKGTDFAVATLAQMTRGVSVLAAAPGTVRGVRDGMPDIPSTSPDAPNVTGRECGNGLVIDHGDGWQTQYCHLKRGSLTVSPGARVAAGARLGLIGLSGKTTFPHVHVSVRRDGAVIDPFRPEDATECGPTNAPDLWEADISYRAGGLIDIGLLDRVPEFDEIKTGLPEDGVSEPSAPIVLWVYMFGGQQGDVLTLDVVGPNGPLGPHSILLKRSQPLLFRAWGRRAPDGGWPDGLYTATAKHERDGRLIDTRRVISELP